MYIISLEHLVMTRKDSLRVNKMRRVHLFIGRTELHSQLSMGHIKCVVRRSKLKWFGHVERKDRAGLDWSQLVVQV